MDFIQAYFRNWIQMKQVLNLRDNCHSLPPGTVTTLCVHVGGEWETSWWVFLIVDNDFWQKKQFTKL